jgi:predicted CXXCH cytochrome family protein
MNMRFSSWKMKRLAFVVVGCAVSLFLGGGVPASADNGPHRAGAGPIADTCAGCHRAHTAQASYLLKQAQPGLCYTCHGAGAAGANTDVQEGVGYTGTYPGRGSPTGALRGGGFEYALLDTANPVRTKVIPDGYDGATVPVLSSPTPSTSSHSVDSSDQTAWGNGATSATANYGKTIQLRCGSCHDPHGNGNYRILKPIPVDSGASGVTIPDSSPKVYTTGNYWRVADTNDLNDGTTGPSGGFIGNIAAWCTTCHTRYLAGSGSYKTSSGDAVYNYRHRGDYTKSGASGSSAHGNPSCIQCHVSHGSNASMGTYSSSVTAPDGTAMGADSRLLRADNRGVCQICHGK